MKQAIMLQSPQRKSALSSKDTNLAGHRIYMSSVHNPPLIPLNPDKFLFGIPLVDDDNPEYMKGSTITKLISNQHGLATTARMTRGKALPTPLQ